MKDSPSSPNRKGSPASSIWRFSTISSHWPLYQRNFSAWIFFPHSSSYSWSDVEKLVYRSLSEGSRKNWHGCRFMFILSSWFSRYRFNDSLFCSGNKRVTFAQRTHSQFSEQLQVYSLLRCDILALFTHYFWVFGDDEWQQDMNILPRLEEEWVISMSGCICKNLLTSAFTAASHSQYINFYTSAKRKNFSDFSFVSISGICTFYMHNFKMMEMYLVVRAASQKSFQSQC